MKPTKEQLADQKWWDENSGGFDFLYECESTNEIVFANREGKDGNGMRLRLELDIWRLLAKRPEPEWVPAVGDVCEYKGVCEWVKCKVDYISDQYIVVFNTRTQDYEALVKSYYKFRPIKTQREELIDLINKHDGCTTGLLAKHILARFDLTEKDGE